MEKEALPYLTKQGLYALSIGFYVKDGKRSQRKFRLGRDRSAAIRKARALRAAWEEETTTDAQGKKVWSEQSIQRALAFADHKTPSITAVPIIQPVSRTPVPVFAPDPPTKPATITAVYTLPQALDEYGKFFSERTDIGQKHREVIATRIKSVKAHIEEIGWETQGTKVWLKDLPMGQIDLEWLTRIRNKITSRPLTRFQNTTKNEEGQGRPNKPISIDVVRSWLMLLGMAFDWFDRTPRLGWTAPHHRWREAFVLTRKQEWALRTPEERDNAGKPLPTFTVDEIQRIYKNSTPLGRKYLLLGVMLGWGQEAIRSMRKNHLVKIGEEYYIDRRRGKTGIEGFWWVCPELAKLLIDSISRTPPNQDNLAFLTEEGLPLVHGHTDTIGLAWDRCLRGTPAGVRSLPFGRLRKLGGQIIENLSSHDLAQLFLANGGNTVARRHYVGNDVEVGIGKTPFERLHEVQKAMYAQLKPLLFGGTPQNEKHPAQQSDAAATPEGEGDGTAGRAA